MELLMRFKLQKNYQIRDGLSFLDFVRHQCTVDMVLSNIINLLLVNINNDKLIISKILYRRR